MDTSPEYVKMCEKAVGLKGHPLMLEKGSRYFVEEPIKVYAFDGSCRTRKEEHRLFYGLSGFKFARHYHYELYPGLFWQIDEGRTTHYFDDPGCRIVWLPTQDQLQELLNESPLSALLGRFHRFWSMTYLVGSRKKGLEYFSTMEQLWLAFAMKEKSGKTWNGEEWI